MLPLRPAHLSSTQLPTDLLQYRAKPVAFLGVNRLDEPHPAFQVCPEVGMRIAVLALRTKPDAVGQDGLETIEIRSPDVHALVGDQTSQVLPHTLSHDTRLAVMHRETLFDENGRDVSREALHASPKWFAA
jgi:hypothetical protein